MKTRKTPKDLRFSQLHIAFPLLSCVNRVLLLFVYARNNIWQESERGHIELKSQYSIFNGTRLTRTL